MKLNYEKILNTTGCSFDTYDGAIAYMLRSLEHFDFHNKNLSLEQTRIIATVRNILEGLHDE